MENNIKMTNIILKGITKSKSFSYSGHAKVSLCIDNHFWIFVGSCLEKKKSPKNRVPELTTAVSRLSNKPQCHKPLKQDLALEMPW
jgi:hypothetical protein